jgi:hypothetical protein
MPAQAGIHVTTWQGREDVDPRLRGGDDKGSGGDDEQFIRGHLVRRRYRDRQHPEV